LYQNYSTILFWPWELDRILINAKMCPDEAATLKKNMTNKGKKFPPAPFAPYIAWKAAT
jgi:hypothetical protein